MSDYNDSLAAFADALKPAFKNLISAKTKDQFDDAFAAIVYDAVTDLEKDSKGLCELGEDSLSTVLKNALNGTLALVVTREESSNGHVDLTFRAPLCKPPRVALGEAKVFNYYKWHESGLQQLLQRYSTGREERGLLLVYVKKEGVKRHMENLRSQLDQVLPCSQQGACADALPNLKWSFISRHEHSSGEEMEVWHLGCNLFHPESKAALEVEGDAEESKIN